MTAIFFSFFVQLFQDHMYYFLSLVLPSNIKRFYEILFLDFFSAHVVLK